MIHKFKRKKFLKDNFVLFVANGLAAAFTYFFHFYVGRTLGPESYGVVGAIVSISYILAVMIYAIQTTVAKEVAEFKLQGEYGKIAYMLKKSLLRLGIIGVIGTVLLLVFSYSISVFLHIPTSYIYLITPIFLFVLVQPVMKGVLLGTQRFTELGWTLITEGLTRFVGAVILIELGFGVVGATIAITLSYLVPIIYALFPLRKQFAMKTKRFSQKKTVLYSVPVLFAMLGIISFFSLDVLLVKHYLSSTDTGLYTAISNLGKIIYFGSITIGMVMFPKVASAINNKKKRHKLLIKSLILGSLIGLPIVALYYVLPSLPISILYGKQYLAVGPYIGHFGLSMLLISLSYILIYYHLARKNYGSIVLLFSFIGLEVLLISLFHQNLSAIVYSILTTSIGIFVSLSIYLFFEKNPTRKLTNVKNLILD